MTPKPAANTNTSSDATPRERDVRIDLVRAVAVLGMLYHIPYPSAEGVVAMSWNLTITVLLLMFFIASGWFIFPLRGSACAFELKRFKAIMPGYIIATVVYAWIIVNIEGHNTHSVFERIFWFLYAPSSGFLWTIPSLLGVYLMVPFLSPWLEKASRRSVEAFLLLCLAAGCIPLASAYIYIREPVEAVFGPFMGFLGLAVAGFWLRRWPYLQWSRRRKLIFSAAWLFVTAMSFRGVSTAVRYGFDYELCLEYGANTGFIAVGLFIFLYHLPMPRGRLARIVSSIGRCTYGIYLSHFAIGLYLLPLLGFWHDTPMPLRIIATFLISWALTAAWQALKRRVLPARLR